MSVSRYTGVPQPTSEVARCWAGAQTTSGFRVVADVEYGELWRLLVSAASDFATTAYVSDWAPPLDYTSNLRTYHTVSAQASGLSANTLYYYRWECKNAAAQTSVTRTAKTAQSAAAAFTVAFGSCSHLDQSKGLTYSVVHRSIALEAPQTFIHLDDLLYPNPTDTTAAEAREKVSRAYLSSPDVDALHRTVPIVYVPGDHDLGPNDSTLDTTDGEAIYKAARRAFKEIVPHYPFVQTGLGETDVDKTILSQVFDFGKVRFMVLDCCSQARATAATALGRGLGNGDYWDQMSWLATALAQAYTDGVEWVFLCLPRGWMDYNQTSYADVFTAERQALCDVIEAADPRVCLVNGDTHACAFDDGTRAASFATDGLAKFPRILASSLYNTPVGAGGTDSWNGTPRFYPQAATTAPVDGYFVLLTMSADNKTWTAVIKGQPFDAATFAATTIATVSSNDATPAVSFNDAAPSIAHGQTLTVNLDKTWFGPCSVNWSGNGQSGTATFKPNKTRASFTVTTSIAGSFNITLSGASGCTISGTNPAVVTVT